MSRIAHSMQDSFDLERSIDKQVITPYHTVITTMSLIYVLLSALAALLVPLVAGHGRLMQPPSRSSAWRDGFPTPANYNDNELFCGGFMHQWGTNGGKCGVCGDPYDGKRENEAGGKYATGTIVATYNAGDVIAVTVEITANHLGWFEFRLCPNNDITKPVTHECLDQHLLPLADGSGTRLPISSKTYFVTVQLQLPAELTCTQCVLQWKYNAGNNWGVDAVTGLSGLGYGPQEQFYGCADVTIVGNGAQTTTSSTTTTSTAATTTTIPSSPTGDKSTRTSTTQLPVTSSTGDLLVTSKPNCFAVNEFAGDKSMDSWCEINCKRGFCPETHCKC